MNLTLFLPAFVAGILAAALIFRSALKKIQARDFAAARIIFEILASDDPVFLGHSIHTLELTRLFYQYLPFEIRVRLSLTSLLYTALLHDIGKTCVSKDILYKPGKLSEKELELVRQHVDFGNGLILQSKDLSFMSNGILYHHERVDGTGYKKIDGNKIPLDAKIIAVADTYSAIVLANSFKPSRSHSDAIGVLKICAGAQLDKNLVEIFCSIPQDKVNACADKAAASIARKNARKS